MKKQIVTAPLARRSMMSFGALIKRCRNASWPDEKVEREEEPEPMYERTISPMMPPIMKSEKIPMLFKRCLRQIPRNSSLNADRSTAFVF
jgi:hypothetical protein